jgi:ATP-dependent exoDNAse (exonuclease V) beta subunit
MPSSSSLILYKASAGSGKTYTLAKEFLKIVIRNPYDYNKILAVTFTRKATEEMKSRIIEYLAQLEQKDPRADKLRNSIIGEIKESSGEDVSGVLDRHAGKALQLILHDYSNFNVSTIDSFFQGIVRSFAKELDLPIGMEVELDTDAVIGQAVQDMLKEYKTSGDAFSRWIEEYLFDLIEEDKSWKIERHISKLAKQILREEYQLLALQRKEEFDIEAYKKVLSELKRAVYEYRKKLNDLTDEVHRKLEKDSVDLSKYFQGTKSVQSFINYTKQYAPEANSYVRKMMEGQMLYSKGMKDRATAEMLEKAWNNYLLGYIREVLDYKEQHHKKYISADIVLKNIYSLALLEFINRKIKEYKANENLILISDTNQIISLIAQHEAVPFIFEKSGNFLKYILIDEFQDTSSLQWKGMLPLLLEILQKINGIVLIVGDPKQSIYRWRGGKMELMVDGIQPDLAYHWESRKDIPLSDNYRSAKEIVGFNNAFFESVKENIELGHPYFRKVLQDVRQNAMKNDCSGYVQCKWLEKRSKDSGEDDPHLSEVWKTIEWVHEKKAYSEIAVLTRNNMHGAAIANYLQERDIPVVSAESLLLHNKLSVRLLIAALEYVAHPEEAFYCVKLNFLYASYLGLENPEHYLLKCDSYFFETKMEKLHRKHIRALSSVSIQELIFILLHELGLDLKIDTYVLRLQDIVLEHSRKHPGSIRDFLEYWNEQKHKLCIIPPDGTDAVKIYTIHKSKGLQFPVVILPYATWKLTPKPESTVWLKSSESPFDQLHAFPVEMVKRIEESLFAGEYNREAETTYMDNINLLYVAFTRAEEQLYIFSTQENDKPGLPQTVSRLLSQTIATLELAGAQKQVTLYEYGNKDALQRSAARSLPAKHIPVVEFCNFREDIGLVSREEYREEQVKGKLMHTVLSKVYVPQHVRKAIQGTVSGAAVETYSAAADKILEIFDSNNWFDPKWKHINERAVWFCGKQLRPDKVLLSDEECIIVDYKTGAKKKEYATQMKEYIEAYRAFYNCRISARLIYLENMEIEAIQLQ